ncbi:hypothetical protein HDV05_002810 [Chytridiales sp. JEL 0842]|nr:hypothetical protein HDV05_002810 [Chytridiales sp. JEL 0842]
MVSVSPSKSSFGGFEQEQQHSVGHERVQPVESNQQHHRQHQHQQQQQQLLLLQEDAPPIMTTTNTFKHQHQQLTQKSRTGSGSRLNQQSSSSSAFTIVAVGPGGNRIPDPVSVARTLEGNMVPILNPSTSTPDVSSTPPTKPPTTPEKTLADLEEEAADKTQDPRAVLAQYKTYLEQLQLQQRHLQMLQAHQRDLQALQEEQARRKNGEVGVGDLRRVMSSAAVVGTGRGGLGGVGGRLVEAVRVREGALVRRSGSAVEVQYQQEQQGGRGDGRVRRNASGSGLYKSGETVRRNGSGTGLHKSGETGAPVRRTISQIGFHPIEQPLPQKPSSTGGVSTSAGPSAAQPTSEDPPSYQNLASESLPLHPPPRRTSSSLRTSESSSHHHHQSRRTRFTIAHSDSEEDEESTDDDETTNTPPTVSSTTTSSVPIPTSSSSSRPSSSSNTPRLSISHDRQQLLMQPLQPTQRSRSAVGLSIPMRTPSVVSLNGVVEEGGLVQLSRTTVASRSSNSLHDVRELQHDSKAVSVGGEVEVGGGGGSLPVRYGRTTGGIVSPNFRQSVGGGSMRPLFSQLPFRTFPSAPFLPGVAASAGPAPPGYLITSRSTSRTVSNPHRRVEASSISSNPDPSSQTTAQPSSSFPPSRSTPSIPIQNAHQGPHFSNIPPKPPAVLAAEAELESKAAAAAARARANGIPRTREGFERRMREMRTTHVRQVEALREQHRVLEAGVGGGVPTAAMVEHHRAQMVALVEALQREEVELLDTARRVLGGLAMPGQHVQHQQQGYQGQGGQAQPYPQPHYQHQIGGLEMRRESGVALQHQHQQMHEYQQPHGRSTSTSQETDPSDPRQLERMRQLQAHQQRLQEQEHWVPVQPGIAISQAQAQAQAAAAATTVAQSRPPLANGPASRAVAFDGPRTSAAPLPTSASSPALVSAGTVTVGPVDPKNQAFLQQQYETQLNLLRQQKHEHLAKIQLQVMQQQEQLYQHPYAQPAHPVPEAPQDVLNDQHQHQAR